MLPSPFDLIPEAAYRHRYLEHEETVFRQDDKTRGLFFIIQGKVELRRFTQAGQSVIIHRAMERETFAEASLFSEHYHCDAIAITKIHIVELDRTVILNKFHSEPDFAMAIAQRFARQNQSYRRKIELLAIKSAEERILTAILEGFLAENIKAFASDIGLSHEVVYRGLANLTKKGKLVKSGRGKYLPITLSPQSN